MFSLSLFLGRSCLTRIRDEGRAYPGGARESTCTVTPLPWAPSPHTPARTLLSLCHTCEQRHTPLLGACVWVLMGEIVERKEQKGDRGEGRGRSRPAASPPSPPPSKVASCRADLFKEAQGAIFPGLLSQRTLHLDSWLYLQVTT